MSTPAQLPFYHLATSASLLPTDLLLAVEELTGITALSIKTMPTPTPTPSDELPPLASATITPPSSQLSLEKGEGGVLLPKPVPPRKPVAATKRKAVSFASTQIVNPSNMAMKLVNEPAIEGAWPDEVPLPAPHHKAKWQQRTKQSVRSAWLKDTVVISLMATRTIVNAFTQSEPWVYKAMQAGVITVLCVNILLGCINVGHQLILASVQRPFAQQLANETKTRHHEIEQSLMVLKKGEGIEMLARGYMDMVEPNQVLVKIR